MVFQGGRPSFGVVPHSVVELPRNGCSLCDFSISVKVANVSVAMLGGSKCVANDTMFDVECGEEKRSEEGSPQV